MFGDLFYITVMLDSLALVSAMISGIRNIYIFKEKINKIKLEKNIDSQKHEESAPVIFFNVVVVCEK